MTTGIAAAEANTALDAIRTDTPFIKLHVGDPGAAGASNAAVETTRKAVTFGAPSGGAMTNTASFQWVGIAGSEDATHFSVWNDVSAGTFKGSGTITANAYTAGDTYTVATSACTMTITVAA